MLEWVSSRLVEKTVGPEHQAVGGAEFEDVGRARLGMPFWGAETFSWRPKEPLGDEGRRRRLC